MNNTLFSWNSSIRGLQHILKTFYNSFNTSTYEIGYVCHCRTLFADQKVVEYNPVFSSLPIDSSATEKEKQATYQTSKSWSPPYCILNVNVCISHRLFVWGIFS